MTTPDRLDPERWRRAVALFERLADLGPEEQERALAEEDLELRLTVVRMLASDETTDTMLDEGVETVAGIALEEQRMEPEVERGDRVESFEILGVLGRGGMGVVYEARDLRLNRPAALKLLPTGAPAGRGASERLFAEARAASALDHPNIETVYQVGESDGRPFIAMARYEGETLRERLRRGPLSREEALEIAIQVARALSVAHAAGIVHRDVKPGNIFLTDYGLVKLLDFGIAVVGTEGGRQHAHGTLRYMSPEQGRLEPPDARSDIWSLGIVLHEMLGGVTANRVSEAALEAAGSGSGSSAPWLDTSDLPKRIDAIVARCLSLDPRRRYGNGAELLEALERCQATSSGAWLGRAALFAGVAIVATLAVLGNFAGGAAGRVPLIAVGNIADPEAIANEAGIGAAGYLTASLANVPDLPLISHARIEQLRAQVNAAGGEAGDRRELATLAGAEVVVEGELGRAADGTLRLALTRLDLEEGTRRPLPPLGGEGLASLFHEGARAVARELGLQEPPPRSPLASTSPLANRLYEEGLRAYYEGDRTSALRLFSAALEEDSTFAMAAFYEWKSHWVDRVGRVGASSEALNVALASLPDLPERERLLIQATHASLRAHPNAGVLAESLVARHPQEIDGHFMLGVADVWGGRPLRAIRHLRRVIEMDSLSLRGVAVRCQACEAFSPLSDAYWQLDSLEAAERTLREWLRWRPESAGAWAELADFFEGVGREEEAEAARREEARFGPGRTMATLFPGRAALRAGRYSEADAMFAERIRNAAPLVSREARWLLAISLREQGRLEEALETERGRVGRPTDLSRTPPGEGTHFEGQILTELGHLDEAVRVWTYLAERGRRLSPRDAPAIRALWPMAHLATALAARGDTAALRVVVDSLETIGARTARARDRRLHHYARGLLLRQQGDLDGAEAELRAAIGPITDKLNRVHLELGRVLLALGRPLEATQPLEVALSGDLEGGHLYVSRTELHEALGRAYEAAGNPELAASHYRSAAEAWEGADPALDARREAIQARLAGLAGG